MRVYPTRLQATRPISYYYGSTQIRELIHINVGDYLDKHGAARPSGTAV